MSTKLFKEIWNDLNGRTPFEKARLTKSEILEVQNVISKLQSKGYNSERIITALQKQNKKLSERWKAERAYWTEIKHDDTEKVGEAGHDLDITKYRVILSPHACEVCREKSLNGSKIFKNSDIEKAGYGHVPPFHPNAVLPDTRILTSGIKKMMRANYLGNAVKIVLSNGTFLSVTENHLILTRRGFIPAHLLSNGDDVICSSAFERIIQQNPNNNNLIPTISDVFDASFKSFSSSTTSVESAPEYLHGDARFCDGNIDIVSTDRFLGNNFKSTLNEEIHKLFFGPIDSSFSFDSLSNLNPVLVGLALSADSIMSGSGVKSILSFSPTSVNDLERFLDSANYDSRLDKSLSNDVSANAVDMSDSVLAFSSDVSFCNVVSVDLFPYHGYVYDLQSSSTLYICNNMITSNCYCILIPMD